MIKTENNKAWLLVLPVFLLVAFSAVIPLMTVVNYSVQDILDPNTAFFATRACMNHCCGSLFIPALCCRSRFRWVLRSR